MNDLLSRVGSKPSSYVDLKQETAVGDLEMGGSAGGRGKSGDDLAPFFEEVNAIQCEMDKVKQLLVKLQESNEETKTITKAQAMKSLRERMDRDVELVLKMAKAIKSKLEDLDRANAANRRIPGCEEGTPPDRTRTSITNSLRKKLKDLMGDFQGLREEIMGEYKETIKRRYYTVTGQNPDDETIDNMIETGESESFLQKAIQSQGRGRILDTISEIQERHDAVMEIERSLLELHQIFLDMAVLVESQGEQLNDIEHNVHQATDYVAQGTQQLQQAKKIQKSSRKWMCIAIIILLVVVMIIIASIIPNLKRG